jgi:hypothetical protein
LVPALVIVDLNGAPQERIEGAPVEAKSRENRRMAIKAIAVDDANAQHLIIGLNRENVDSLLRGDVFTLPHRMAVQLSVDSDIVLLFAETDDELGKRFPPSMRPV